MNKLRQIIKASSAFLLVMALHSGWNPVFAETASISDEQRTQKPLNLSGLFFGFTPCDDCQGVKTTLALNKNETYVFITQYVGKSDREFVEKGKFAVSSDNGNTLILTPRKGGTDTHQYLIDDDMLVKLDEDGNRITKDGADRYILRRKDIMKTPVDQHGGH